jgi:SSS family transporter
MESPVNPTVHPIDLAIIVVYMVGVVLFGMWIGRGQKDLSSYLLGDRNIPWWGLMGSIVSTETSSATFLSIPGLAFAAKGDLRFLQLAMGFVLGRIVVAFVLLPLYFRGELYSAYEVLQQRFGTRAKQGASLMFLVARNLGDGLRLYLAGLVLQQAAGIDLHLSIVIMGGLTIVYTFFGGMKAIIWTDCIQFVVYVSGGVLAGILLLRGIPGGWNGLIEYGTEHQKWRMFNFDFDLTERFTIWSGLIGGMMLTLGTHGTDQMMVQRYLSARSRSAAGWALAGSGVIVFVQFLMFLTLGVALAAFYAHHEPKIPFNGPDQVFATYIVTEMPRGCIGFLLAAIISAAMTSSLNSSASTLATDFYLPARGISPDSRRALMITRGLTIFFGALQIAVGIIASFLSESVVSEVLAVAGFAFGILLGMFGLGVLTRRVGQTGALVGMVTGIGVLLWIRFGTLVAWPWYSSIGFSSTFFAGVVFTLLFSRERSAA